MRRRRRLAHLVKTSCIHDGAVVVVVVVVMMMMIMMMVLTG